MSNKDFLIFSILALVLINLTEGYGTRTRDRMYRDINGAGCFRRMNGTHQFGCSSSRRGSTGVIYFIDNELDIKAMITNGTASSYIPVMSVEKLTWDIVELLKTSHKINGLVIYRLNDTELEHYSHEDKCPNRNFAVEGTCDIEWNSPGTNLLNYDFDYPVFYATNNSELAEMKNCFKTFNNFSLESHYERSLCSLELNFFMFAVIDTPTCLRRSEPRFNFNNHRVCDPIGSKNVWASLFPIGNSTVTFGNTTHTDKIKSDMKYILLSSRLDTTSLFFGRAPGAINPITNIVTLLYTAYLLKQLLPKYENYDKNVLFTLFSGESYDYTGSQRFLYDMEENLLPDLSALNQNESASNILPSNISLFIDLNQMSVTDVLHAHLYEETPELRDFITKLSKYKGNMNLSEHDGRIPPSSLQTFIRKYPNISGIVLTDHDTAYLNKFYNSMYDDVNNLNYQFYNSTEEIPNDSIQRHIANVSQTLAFSLFEEITGKQAPPQTNQNISLVDELLYCYLKNLSCPVHQVIQKKRYREEPISLYVGVPNSVNIVVNLVGLTLAWLTSDTVNATGPCPGDIDSNLFTYYNMSRNLTDNTTVCYRSCINFTESSSPAFIIDDYDWKSGQYSSWTESSWYPPSIRMFLRPSRVHENMIIALGSLTMVLSFVLVYLIKSRSHILFPPVHEATSPTRC